MAERVLTQRDLNRALLARQMLLERSRTSLPKALERMGTLQAQYAPSMYVGLWSRVEGFERDALTRALERGTVVQGTLMRSTIHLVSRGDYWPIAVAIRDARRKAWAKYGARGAVAKQMPPAAKRLRAALRKQSPMRRVEVHDLLGKESVGHQWRERLAGPGAGAALGHLGAAAGGSLRRRRGLGRPGAARATRTGSSCSSGATWAALGPPRSPTSPTGQACRPRR